MRIVSLIVQKALVFVACLAIVSPVAALADPYLSVEPQIAQWLPAQPQPGDLVDTGDLAAYFATRPLAQAGSQSLTDAQADDVLLAPDLAKRFAVAAGGPLDAKELVAMMARILDDDSAMLTPLKRDVGVGGRVRPYVRFPQQPVCDHAVDDAKFHLNLTGSYPSGHATFGWMWGLVLSSILPERADAIMAKAYGFGESRLICGFHYPSDLTAGRLAAAALFAKLQTDQTFRSDLAAARVAVRSALKLAPLP